MTLEESNNADASSAYSYEATKIELLAGLHGETKQGLTPPRYSNNSISATNLLQGVEKSYDKGKFLLDESEDLTDGVRFRIVEQENHPFELSEVKGLPMAVQNPIAVFRSATRLDSMVVFTEMEHKGKNVLVDVSEVKALTGAYDLQKSVDALDDYYYEREKATTPVEETPKSYTFADSGDSVTDGTNRYSVLSTDRAQGTVIVSGEDGNTFQINLNDIGAEVAPERPSVAVDARGKADYLNSTPEATFEDINRRLGSEDKARQFAATNLDRAQKGMQRAESELGKLAEPAVTGDIEADEAAMAAYVAKQEQLRVSASEAARAAEYWGGVMGMFPAVETPVDATVEDAPAEVVEEQAPAEEPTPVEETPTEQPEPKPVDKRGEPVYHLWEVDDTVDYIVENHESEADASEFIDIRLDMARRERAKAKPPKKGGSIAQNKANQQAYEESLKQLDAMVDYWEMVRLTFDEIFPPAVDVAVETEVAEEQPQQSYTEMSEEDTVNDLLDGSLPIQSVNELIAYNIAKAKRRATALRTARNKVKPPQKEDIKVDGSKESFAERDAKYEEAMAAYEAKMKEYDDRIFEQEFAAEYWNTVKGMVAERVGQQAAVEANEAEANSTSGVFGNIYNQFKGKAKEAISFLMGVKEGVAVGALHHNELGDIDIVWGNERAGLEKIAQKHPEVLDDMQSILDGMQVVKSSENRAVLESPTHKAVVSKEMFGKPSNQWLLTAYEKKSNASASSIDIETESVDMGDGTAAPQSVALDDKNSNSTIDTQENSENNLAKVDLAREVAERMGLDIHIIEDVEQLPPSEQQAIDEIRKGNRGVRGWFNPNTGEAYIYAPHIVSVLDTEKTIWHEIVAHKGMRKLLGKEYNNLLRSVWGSMSEGAQREMIAYAIQSNDSALVDAAMENEKDQLKAADEYIARLAEGGIEDATVWEKIKAFVRDFMANLNINSEVTDDDIRNLLRASYANLQRGDGTVDSNSNSNSGDVRFRTVEEVNERMKNLETAEQFILQTLQGDAPKKGVRVTLPARINKEVEAVVGHRVASHTINANEVRHAAKKHGVGNETSSNQVGLRKEDFALMPYVMASPTSVTLGSKSEVFGTTVNSVRYTKELDDRKVVVVERELGKNNTHMGNVTMWVQLTADRVVVADKDHAITPETHPLSPSDIAKIRKDAEMAVVEDVNNGEDVRFRYTAEEQGIVDAAVADGSYLNAPNGAKSKLSARQWVQVRTKAFKEWFGDWEKSARIEKLRESEPVVISGEEIPPSDDLKQYKKNALEYGKSLRGEYVNSDTGAAISLGKQGVKEVLQHDYKEKEQMQSIAAIPQIIESAIYIDTLPNEDKAKNPEVVGYDYYVCGLNIGDTEYTVRAAIAVDDKGNRYYDHKLTKIEKGKLLDAVFGITNPAPQGESSLSDVKDKRLVSLLQTNSSKVVDVNGEPLVVYHGSRDGGFSVFDESEGDKQSDAPQGSSWFTSDRSNAYSYSGEYGNASYEEEGGGIYEVFLNIRDPFVENFEGASWTGELYGKFSVSYVDEYGDSQDAYSEKGSRFFDSYEEAEDFATTRGYEDYEIVDYNTHGYDVNEIAENVSNGYYGENDGVIIEGVVDSGSYGEVEATDYVTFSPSQIKSATDNTGAFSSESEFNYSASVYRFIILYADTIPSSPAWLRSEIPFSSSPCDRCISPRL